MTDKFAKAKPLSLKSHPAYNERWLQGVIVDDPALLGLGDLDVKDIERRQPRGGRLDILLVDPETSTRYEVEVQLGATDESHIIRTIEYWDVERNRYPNYDHVAVIVAEDVTSRFLNVMSLLNRSVPLIAVQLNAWDVAGTVTLKATRVLDHQPVVAEGAGQAADRRYWAGKSSPAALGMVDQMLDLVREALGDSTLELKYNRHDIGLARNGVADNFVTMSPQKMAGLMRTELRAPHSDELADLLQDAGILFRYSTRYETYLLRLAPEDLVRNRALLTEVFRRGQGMEVDAGTPPVTAVE